MTMMGNNGIWHHQSCGIDMNGQMGSGGHTKGSNMDMTMYLFRLMHMICIALHD
jgi:hypothetical protein